ncbi:Rid family detoxifying hydrolase [Arthrobacter sp. zg-Y40]|uniref:Rid family detoxifying hydrolase n=1 Tax=unclassified Arthrobacter TaxID=235627 RepID=UPI001D14EEBF|nr:MULTISPECIES: Rid family detoxifying hydrolase [unclassified Arthrobacter]MCC3279965.1 Rid family detoxifying hydrolase [Arthrobacter sp. zg-Y40]MDK1328315.1 Rid family detoxifying hydrolase [Arthrobacter sp. zg-Y1143]
MTDTQAPLSTLTAVSTSAAPAAIGPYSQAVRAGGLVFVSGQLPLDPVTGELTGSTAAEQAEQSLRNIEAILGAAGTSLDKVVKTTVLLADINDFAAVNEVYSRFFHGEVLPARAAYAVAALPKGAQVEIELVAAAG